MLSPPRARSRRRQDFAPHRHEQVIQGCCPWRIGERGTDFGEVSESHDDVRPPQSPSPHNGEIIGRQLLERLLGFFIPSRREVDKRQHRPVGEHALRIEDIG